LDPRDAKAENNLGLIFESEAKVIEALDAYRQAIAWQQASPRPSEQPYVNLGNLLMKEGRTEEAIPHFAKSRRPGPEECFLSSQARRGLSVRPPARRGEAGTRASHSTGAGECHGPLSTREALPRDS